MMIADLERFAAKSHGEVRGEDAADLDGVGGIEGGEVLGGDGEGDLLLTGREGGLDEFDEFKARGFEDVEGAVFGVTTMEDGDDGEFLTRKAGRARRAGKAGAGGARGTFGAGGCAGRAGKSGGAGEITFGGGRAFGAARAGVCAGWAGISVISRFAGRAGKAGGTGRTGAAWISLDGARRARRAGRTWEAIKIPAGRASGTTATCGTGGSFGAGAATGGG